MSERKIVIPGEILSEDSGKLPGENTFKEGEKILSNRYGILEDNGKLVKVIPISGVFVPRRGNVVIAQVADLTFNGWLSDVNTAHSAFLPVAEIPKYLDKNHLSEFLDIGDFFTAKIKGVKAKGIDLTMDGRGLGKLEGGMILKINPHKVPRVIGKEGSMIKVIKDETNCRITVGQNGIVWIKGEDVEEEILAKKAILFITEKSLVNGLTEKVQEFLKLGKEK
jgi:exosome complex component RRP4